MTFRIISVLIFLFMWNGRDLSAQTLANKEGGKLKVHLYKAFIKRARSKIINMFKMGKSKYPPPPGPRTKLQEPEFFLNFFCYLVSRYDKKKSKIKTLCIRNRLNLV